MAIFPAMTDRSGMLRAMWRRAQELLGRRESVGPELTRRTQRFGSAYGGWEVAVEELHRHSIVYSFGIGEDLSFDLALIQRFGLTVHAFDPTPQSLRWIERQRLPPELVVHGYGIAATDGLVAFYPPEREDQVSYSVLPRHSPRGPAVEVPVRRLGSIQQELGHDHIDLLKLDIEGAEYAVIEDLERGTLRPSQLLVEFHHRFPGAGLARTRAALAALRRLGYRVFARSRRGTEYGLLLCSTS